MLASDPAISDHSEPLTAKEQDCDLGNSDRIRLKFGNYGIEIIENDLRIRVSNLYSMGSEGRTNRTFAVVFYPPVIKAAFRKEHQAINDGQSIGIVFKENGWLIDKRHQYIGELEPLPDFTGIHSVFGDIGTIRPVIHVYSLFIKKDEVEHHYASIAEVHHPDYLDLEKLKSIFGANFDGGQLNDQDTIDFLKIVAGKMQGR